MQKEPEALRCRERALQISVASRVIAVRRRGYRYRWRRDAQLFDDNTGIATNIRLFEAMLFARMAAMAVILTISTARRLEVRAQN